MKTAVVCMPTTVSAFQFNSQQQRQQQGLLYDKDCNIRDRPPKSRGSFIIPLTLGNGRKEELFFLTGRDAQEKEARGGEAICYKWLMVKEKGSSKCSTSSIFLSLVQKTVFRITIFCDLRGCALYSYFPPL